MSEAGRPPRSNEDAVSPREKALRFEDEVRRIARLLWPSAAYCGAAIAEGRERDGVFKTEECIHLLEATTSRQKSKAVEDATKLVKLALTLKKRKHEQVVQCWLVTRDEPTGEQRTAVARLSKTCPVKLLSFAQFQSKLIDAPAYLSAREDYRFGSIRDPLTGDQKPSIDYIAPVLTEGTAGGAWDIARLTQHIMAGGRAVLLGDYGVGKSMTLREVYRRLRAAYDQKETPRFPLYVNLRDHHGQSDPVEILHRHARLVGFSSPEHLVRAWRAGYATVILDGFDELTTLVVQGAWRRLRDSRFRAMEAVRRFIRDTPSKTGVVAAGRAHYFDSANERQTALGADDSFAVLSLGDFTDEQVAEYLRRSRSAACVPPWMPTRPLLIGYLVARSLLPAQQEGGQQDDLASADPAQGWDHLLDKIAHREAEIEAGIDPQAVRRVMERLATFARSSQDGLGPLGSDRVVEAFRQVAGHAPDEQAMVLLQRLPGLGVSSAAEDARTFIDADLADACRAGDVVAYINDPFNTDPSMFRYAECTLGVVGLRVAAIRLRQADATKRKVNAALERASTHSGSNVLLADIAMTALERGDDITETTYVRDVVVDTVDLDETVGDLSALVFQGCYFGKVVLEAGVDERKLPTFHGCMISELEGRTSAQDLPKTKFVADCIIDRYSEAVSSTDSILALQLPIGIRVVLTLLRKIYIQRGSGRLESALRRGLDHASARLVPDALHLIRSTGLVTLYRRRGAEIWQPVRTQMARVNRMLSAPNTANDPVLKEAARIG